MSALAVCPPSTVPMVALVTVAEFDPLRPKEFETANREVAFVPMAAVSEDGAMRVLEYRDIDDLGTGYTYFQNGDILVAKITPCFENNKIALVNIDRFHGFGSTEFHVIRPAASRLDRRYLLHLLRLDRIRSDGERRMTGSAGQRRVPRSFLQELQIPLPPLEEQRRIAAILDQADTIRRQRRVALERFDDLSQSLFRDMFGDPLTNSKGWNEDRTLGELTDIVSGITKGRKLNGAPVREVPYMAVANVQDRHLKLDTVKTIEATEAEIARYRLEPDDLLLTEGGDPDKLGRGTLWADELPECIHQNHVFRVRLTSGALHPVFLNWLVGSERGKRYFLRSAKQTTGIASINMGQLRQFPLLLPPLSLQQAFAERVRAIEALKEQHRAHLAQLDTLFASLQHRAFSGEL